MNSFSLNIKKYYCKMDAEKYSKLLINHIYQARLCPEE
jgi:hypothetical protein